MVLAEITSNHLVVLGAGFASFAVGHVLYGVLPTASLWEKSISDEKRRKDWTNFGASFPLLIAMELAMNILRAHCLTFAVGIVGCGALPFEEGALCATGAAFWTWFGFVVLVIVGHTTWEGRKWTATLIDLLCDGLRIGVVAIILTYFGAYTRIPNEVQDTNVIIEPMPVVYAALAQFVIGAIIYSMPPFASTWVDGIRSERRDPKWPHSTGPSPFTLLPVEFVLSFLKCYILVHNLVFAGVTNVQEALVGAFFSWLGFTFSTQLGHNAWENRSGKAMAVNHLCDLARVLVAAAILFNLHASPRFVAN